MKRKIDQEQWKRQQQFLFFNAFDNPFFGITVSVDCTIAYNKAKKEHVSFFLYYLYRALKAANQIINFRYRILDGQVYVFDQIDASPTVLRKDNTFGFAYLKYSDDEATFMQEAEKEIKRVTATNEFIPAQTGEQVIHCSTLPWLNFTAIEHAQNFGLQDSCPKLTFGQITETNNRKTMSVAIHVHHGLVDGLHVGQFVTHFQELLNEA